MWPKEGAALPPPTPEPWVERRVGQAVNQEVEQLSWSGLTVGCVLGVP